MKNMIAIAVFSALIVSFAFGQKAELTAKDVTEKLQRRYEMIDDAVVEFKQHVKLAYSGIEQSFSGTFSMRKPNRYRIETESQTIVTDGATVWAYSPANQQVIIDHYKENQNSVSPEKFLLKLPSDFYVAMLSSEQSKAGTLLVLKLTPKDDRSFVKTMKVWVEEGSWTVRKVLTIDVNDTETIYQIDELKLNSNLKDKTFTFTAPQGTETVDLR